MRLIVRRFASKSLNLGKYLATFNVGLLKAPIDHVSNIEFRNALDPINAIASSSPGFIWYHDNDSFNNQNQFSEKNVILTGVPELDENPLLMPQLSLWKDYDSLKHFVFKSGHFQYLRRRKEWFVMDNNNNNNNNNNSYANALVVLWNYSSTKEKPYPTLIDAFDRLRYLRDNGDTEHAFGLKNASKFSNIKS